MATRRELLKGLGGAAVAAFAGAAAARTSYTAKGTSPAWPRYGAAPVIDGAGGVSLAWYGPDDPAVPGELAAIRASGLTAVVLTLAPSGRFWLDDAAFEKTKANFDTWEAIVARHSDHLTMIRTADDLDRARRDRRLGLICTFQGTESLGEDLDRVSMFRERGLRVLQLTHNRRNLVGDGCMEPGNAGLSNFGHEVIARIEAEKIVLDVAHGAARTMAEGIAAARRPMLISHTGCRALADLPRNTDDATLRALAGKGGVAGMIFWPYLRTDTQPMAEDLIRHIEHAIDVAGEDHVGLGTDGGVAPIARTPEFEKDNREWVAGSVADGIFGPGRPPDLYTFIPDLNQADRFDRLAFLLSKRGHSDARIEKVLGANFARVMREVWG